MNALEYASGRMVALAERHADRALAKAHAEPSYQRARKHAVIADGGYATVRAARRFHGGRR